MPLSKLSPPLAVLLLLAAPSLVQGQPAPAERWSPVGPLGGTITALAVAPGARRTLYAGTAEGVVFRSEDAGARWAYVGAGLPDAPLADLDVDPRHPATVYAAVCRSQAEPPFDEGGIYKSTDGGRAWRLVSAAIPGCFVFEVAIDPFDPARLFAATPEGLHRSGDGGDTWQPVTGFPQDPREGTVTTVTFDPLRRGTLYALHRSLGLRKSADGGATWSALGTGLPAARDLTELEVDRRRPGTLWIAAADARQIPNPAIAPVYRSGDGGATWTAAAEGLGGRRVFDLAAARTHDTLYAATADGVFRSPDGGRRWTAPAAGSSAEARVVAALGPAGVVYAGTGGPGVVKSTDRGATFRPANGGLHGVRVDRLAIAPSDPAVRYAVFRGRNVHRSDDAGATWRPASAGLPVEPFLIVVDPHDARTALASQFSGRIWKTADGGASWRLTTGDETACMLPIQIVFDRRPGGPVYAVGFGLSCPQFPDVCHGFKSTDGGESWTCMADLVESYFSLGIDPADSARLFVGGLGEVLGSVDAGSDWAEVGPGVPPGLTIGSLAPTPGGAVYAGSNQGLFRHTGGSWARVEAARFPSVVDLVAAPSDPGFLVALARVPGAAGTTIRLDRSPDAGASWRPVPLAGLPPEIPTDVIVHPARPRVLYALTRAGIYRLSRPAPGS